MLILLPPSETKRDGGSGSPLDLRGLTFPGLTGVRKRVLSEVRVLSRNRATSIVALGLGPSQHGEVDRNRAVTTSATMSAIDRYTGVLYDALDPSTLSDTSREFSSAHVLIQSALLGPVGALDEIPAYRLSFDSRLPELSLKKHWAQAVREQFARVDGLIIDARSEGYAALGPVSSRPDAHFLRVVSRDSDGRKRELNHFNKQAKGLFTRAMVESGIDHPTADSLLDWAAGEGFELTIRGTELELVVPEIAGVAGSLRAVLR